jgi:glycosyltransferase involved in cell wall biosynthesis
VTAVHISLEVSAVAGCLYWFVSAALYLRARGSVPDLAGVEPRPGSEYPLVSLVVPARNEEHTLEAALESRLGDDYPHLEVVLVEDRSTDATPALVDRIAARLSNVRALHLTELPQGWLGKVNALDRGARYAEGDWLLFSDADVHFEPGTLRRCVTWAEARRLDHLVVFPRILSKGFWLSAVISDFARILLTFGRVWGVEDPRSSAFVGIGAFNLVRRSAWEATEGFAWLRLEPADDLGLGMLMKQTGYRSGVLRSGGLMTVEWYPTLGAMVVGAEKASFSLCNYSLTRTLLSGFVLLMLELGPLIALLPLGATWLPFLGLAAILVAWACSLSINRWVGLPLLPALFVFVGGVLQFWMIVRAGVLGAWRGGIVWRGTFYPLSVLREGRRVRFP